MSGWIQAAMQQNTISFKINKAAQRIWQQILNFLTNQFVAIKQQINKTWLILIG